MGALTVRSLLGGLAGVQLFTMLLWAFVLGLPELQEAFKGRLWASRGQACRDLALEQLEPSSVRVPKMLK